MHPGFFQKLRSLGRKKEDDEIYFTPPKTKLESRWRFQICFSFALTWGNGPILQAYVSNGLKPPPRINYTPNYIPPQN